MGIPGFFNTISKNYHMGISSTHMLKSPDVHIDFNSLIYTSKFIVGNILTNFIKFKLGLEYDQTIQFDQYNKLKFIDLSNPQTISVARDSMIFESIGKLITSLLIQTTNPSVYIWIDGVPHIGKMIEQRKRSLLGGLITRAKEIVQLNTNPLGSIELEYLKLETYAILDKLVIKPGTGFMVKLETWLKSTYPNYKIDGFANPGEAEHKIMDHLINNPTSNPVLVYSPDADMIVLLLPLSSGKNKSNSLYLVRDSLTPIIYDLAVLVQDIKTHFVNLTKPGSGLYSMLEKVDELRLIYDVCFIYNIFGNDFLPKLDAIDIYDKSVIGRVLTQYIKYLNKNIKTYPLDKSFLTNEYGINWIGYSLFLEFLDQEFGLPKVSSSKPFKSDEMAKLNPSNYYDQVWSLNNWGKGFYTKQPDQNVWVQDSFYTNTIYFEESDTKSSIICDYCVGILMVGLLYTKVYVHKLTPQENQILTMWYYPHHKAPLIQDICTWLKSQLYPSNNLKLTIRDHLKHRIEHFPKSFVPTWLTQLYYVIPRYSDFIDLVGQSYAQTYPELPQHKIYEQFVAQLVWDKKTSRVNIDKLVDCNSQRFIDKCIPLLKSKLNDQWVNLIFDPMDWFKS